jgi:hypothetical protein
MTIPKIDLAASSPRFAAALRKERQLGLHLETIDGRIAAAHAGLAALSHSRDERAVEMLSATDLDAVASGGEAGLRDELGRLEGDRRTTLRAMDLARQETAQARGEASAKVCRELLPEYRARVDELARALLVAHRAHAEMDALTNELDRAGAGWTGQLRPMPIKFFREVGFSDPLPAWIREARLHRLTDVEFPENWVRLWNTPPPVEEALDHDGDSMSISRFFRKRAR